MNWLDGKFAMMDLGNEMHWKAGRRGLRLDAHFMVGDGRTFAAMI
jgi:hypothetical protein